MSEGNENIRFPSFEHVSMNQGEKEDVYSRLVESMEKKGRKKQRLVPTLLTALLAALFILAGGYLLLNTVMTDQTASREGEVKEVLERIFTGPDDELASLMEQEDRYIEEGNREEYFDLFLSYYKDLFRPYMSPDTIEQYVNESKLSIQVFTYTDGYHLKAEKIDVKLDKKREESYSFTVDVRYEKEGGKRGTVKVSGDMAVDEEGMISSIRYRDEELWGENGLIEKTR
ncbi:hypothetical protein QU593_19250 [Rossellomorea marisflavi]|uniref:hypothetical protein n=1 Tax=Rossellomorea marisflavi TaxID=189381 RepID=UPI0025AEEE0E|nr:hypothetical protein [Rossellomorea marisflavi]WJV18242.1 hypothetical protein QU593_19250 [Rossellomorea marisflavi]